MANKMKMRLRILKILKKGLIGLALIFTGHLSSLFFLQKGLHISLVLFFSGHLSFLFSLLHYHKTFALGTILMDKKTYKTIKRQCNWAFLVDLRLNHNLFLVNIPHGFM